MAALFTYPLPFTAASTSPAPLAGSVANVAIDPPGLIWRFGLTTPYLIVDLGAGTLSYDTVAIVGSNLRSTDTIQVRTGATNTGVGGYAGTATAAWSGYKADTETAITVIRLGTARTERYVRIDFVATGHPDTWVQFQRLVVGKSVLTMGTDFNAEMGFEDSSVITSGPGYRSVDEYPVVTSWKISTGWISEASWRSDWYPMLQSAGSRRGILFVPDDTTNYQTDMIFGPITSKASGKAEFYNAWRFEGTITSLAA